MTGLLAAAAARSARWLALVAAVGVACACSPAPEAPRNPSASGAAGVAGAQAIGGNEAAAGAGGTGNAGGTAGAGGSAPGGRRYSLRGIGCTVKNDCAEGFSCIQGVCQPSSFGLVPSAKECVQIDCSETADCCGNLPMELPEKCRSRASSCLPLLPGCVQKACTRAGECGGGGACVGRCGVTNGECRGNQDCLANKCVEGKCSLNFTACGSDAECGANTCSGGACACANPNYSPLSPVCSDQDCEGLCLWACEGSRCTIPSSCENDAQCFGTTPLCIDKKCVECSVGTDCSFDKICVDGSCQTPCKSDAQCGLFEACQAGECTYVGCRSHRECTLVPDVRSIGLAPGVDPRQLRCHTEDGIGRCLVPCQTDSQCGPTTVCTGGLCQYIGCETSAECATILGVHEQVTTDQHPWVASVECRASAE